MPRWTKEDLAIYEAKKSKKPAPKQDERPLEDKFQQLWVTLEGPRLELEHKFHPERRWKIDFFVPSARVGIEIEGGVWKMGRHNNPQGFINDAEKYFEATMAGILVVRLTPNMLNLEILSRLVAFCLSREIEIDAIKSWTNIPNL